ncbi:MAG: cache domain-containing protein [Bauldia sp.]|nr:cache domain-containing protein [Bauldia sp.]
MRAAIAALFVAIGVLATPAAAQQRGTTAEAQAMAEAAAAFLVANGPEVAYPAFNDGAEWHDRDLYVFVIADGGVNLAHGANHDLIGTNIIDLVDRNGVYLVREFLEVRTEGWVDYVYTDPLTGLDEPKSSYVIRIGGLVVGVGAYLVAERASLDEALVMAEAAADLLATAGPDAAFAAFDTDPVWRDRDLYVFALRVADGMTVAHGADAARIGTIQDLVDRNGVYFIRAFIAVETAGWVAYVFTNPVTGVDEAKQSYIVRVGDYVVGVGAYTP